MDPTLEFAISGLNMEFAANWPLTGPVFQMPCLLTLLLKNVV